MNASRLLNLAAIFSLDLESQFTCFGFTTCYTVKLIPSGSMVTTNLSPSREAGPTRQGHLHGNLKLEDTSCKLQNLVFFLDLFELFNHKCSGANLGSSTSLMPVPGLAPLAPPAPPAPRPPQGPPGMAHPVVEQEHQAAGQVAAQARQQQPGEEGAPHLGVGVRGEG